MKSCIALLAISAVLSAASCTKKDTGTSPTPSGPTLGFFVSSRTSMTGNLGGLRGADATCQSLGAAVGQGSRGGGGLVGAHPDARGHFRVD